MKPLAVVIFSGGMDSGTLAYHMASFGCRVHLMSFNYGQRHAVELEWAALFWDKMKNHYPDTTYRTIDMALMGKSLMAGSSQTSDIPVPEGHYAADSMKATVVPNRNMVMLSMAGAFAISQKATYLCYGAHAGDHTIYPDCRPEFIAAMREAFEQADFHRLTLLAPFEHATKAEIVRMGERLEVPFHRTWSCYKGGRYHCGKCGTCVERKEAFRLAKVTDPTSYEDPPPF